MKMRMAMPPLIVSLASQLLAQDLALKIQAPTNAIHIGDYPKFVVAITNQGKIPVTLVEPGDGSESKMRTPVVGWSAIPSDKRIVERHPEQTPLDHEGRCGNINAIKLREVFTLKPSDTHAFSAWIGTPTFPKPGKYHLVFYYENIPDLPVSGIPLGGHEPGAIEKIRQSHACRLVSNELIVEVLPKKEAGNAR